MAQKFGGFKPGKPKTITIHAEFFSEVLPAVGDLAELKVILFCYWALTQKEGEYRYLRYDDFLNDATLMRGLAVIGENTQALLDQALEKAIRQKIILNAKVSLESGQERLYFLNTAIGRAAIRQIELGQWQPGEEDSIEILPERPNIFTLYEENIGPLTPIIAERLKIAESEYKHEWLVDAINIAIENNVRRWKYISTILERWQEEGRADGANETNERRNQRDNPFAGLTWADFAD